LQWLLAVPMRLGLELCCDVSVILLRWRLSTVLGMLAKAARALYYALFQV